MINNVEFSLFFIGLASWQQEDEKRSNYYFQENKSDLPIRVLSYLVPKFPNDLLLGGSIPRTYLAKKKKKTHSFEDRTGWVNKTSLTYN